MRLSASALAERHPVHPVHVHGRLELLPRMHGVTARHPSAGLRLSLHSLQLHLHVWVHRDEHLRRLLLLRLLCLRRMALLALVLLLLQLLLLMLLLLLQESRVLLLRYGMRLLLLLLLLV